jgi:anti-sigma regulatory factor (Ser/Thr protein kinase)
VADDASLMMFPAVAKHAADEFQIAVLLCAASDALAESFHALGLENPVPLYPTAAAASCFANGWPVMRTALRLASTPEAPAIARAFVDESCAQWRVPGEVAEALRLISTELVTNVVVHADTPMRVILRRSRRHIHVAVMDEEPRLAMRRPPVSPQSASGRGLIFVEAFSSAWGCTPTATGKSTWATLTFRT